MLDAVAYQGANMPANLPDTYAAALAHRGNHAEASGRHSHEAGIRKEETDTRRAPRVIELAGDAEAMTTS